MPSKQKTVLVPGTQATALRDQNGNRVYNAVRVQMTLGRRDLGSRDPDEVGKLLGMEHTPGVLKPTRTSLETDTHIVRGDVLQTPYDGLPVTTWFRYDWRADLRFNAYKLLETLRDETRDGGRCNLIGHSQGGLIIVLASKLADSPREFASLVGRAVLIGAPLAGTMRALEAIMFGRDDLGDENRTGILAAARTWPALYQMLPAWASAVTPAGEVLPADEQLIWPKGWGALMKEGIQEDLLQRARETQALLRGPFSHMAPGVATLTIMGNRQATGIAVVRNDGEFDPKFATATGDSLVPETLTSDLIGPPVFDRRVILAGSKVKAHAMLCVDPDVQSRVRTFFKQPLPPIPAA